MALVNGNVEMTKGSEDPVPLQLMKDDGVTPWGDITGATGITIYMREPDGTLKLVTTGITITDGPNAKIQLAHAASEFPDVKKYEYKVKFTLSSKVRFVPDGSKWNTWEIFDDTP